MLHVKCLHAGAYSSLTVLPDHLVQANLYQETIFGQCPRVYCNNHPMLPIGLSDELGKETLKVFCPSCRDVYRPFSDHLAAVSSQQRHMCMSSTPALSLCAPCVVGSGTCSEYGMLLHLHRLLCALSLFDRFRCLCLW